MDELTSMINDPMDDKTGLRPDIQTTIKSKYNSLSKAQQRIADFILNNIGDVIYLTITEVAEKASVGEATISRFCWSLGYKGFQDMKLVLAQDNAYINGLTTIIRDESSINDMTRLIASRITRVIEGTIQTLDEQSIEKAVDALAKARKIDFYGVGSSGVLAIDASHMFLGIGKLTTAYTDPHVQVMSAALLTNQDVAVAFSHSGSTKDTVTALSRARKSGAFTICITSYARSPISQVADVVLLAAVGETVVVSSIYTEIGGLFITERLYAGCLQKTKDSSTEAINKITNTIMDKMY